MNRAAFRPHPTWRRKPNRMHDKTIREDGSVTRKAYGFPRGSILDGALRKISRGLDRAEYRRDPDTGVITCVARLPLEMLRKGTR